MKNEIRKNIKQKRKELTAEEISEKSLAASLIFISSDLYKKSRNIMLYMPILNETDTSYIIKKALSDNKKLILPKTDEKTGEITPYYADENTCYKKGGFSVYEPESTEIADKEIIDTVIVPGIAFDRKGVRVGFGKGCYDRFLENINAIKIGLCYDFQICENILSDFHDIKMDYLISEKEIIECEK